jgi:hypothetical protein
MLWAGANPRTPGPSLFEGHEDDPDWHTTAVKEACYHGHVEILKKFKLRPDTDDPAELVGCVLSPRNSEALNYILSLGGNLNNKPNGGSTAMDRCLGHIKFDNFDPLRRNTQISRYDVSKTLDTMKKLAVLGARWRPESDQIGYIRKDLYRCEPRVTVEVVKILAEKNSASQETLEELLAAPKMSVHLASLGINLPIAPKARAQKQRQNRSAKQAS